MPHCCLDCSAIRNATFGYALANGTVGVYSGPGHRRWRVKAKHEVTCISGFDLDGDGEAEMLSGWANGKFEVRSEASGEVIYKDVLNGGTSISGILHADYRGDGRTEVLVCSSEGEVRGYLPAGEELAAMVRVGGGLPDDVEDEKLRELSQRKQALLFELRQCDDQRDATSRGAWPAAGPLNENMQISAHLVPSTADNCLYLTLESLNNLLIKAAVIFADGLFEGSESIAVHERSPSAELRVPLTPTKDISAELSIKARLYSHSAVLPNIHAVLISTCACLLPPCRFSSVGAPRPLCNYLSSLASCRSLPCML